GDTEYLSLALITRPAADLRRPLVLDAHGQRAWLDADTSNVTVQGQDILPRLQAEAEAAVRLLGFTPSPNA
ncbi:hypothetical protein R0G64_32300, partial [Pseudomonas otitidis]|nr:hypothetical protein [Pseudomonas otitidis]